MYPCTPFGVLLGSLRLLNNHRSPVMHVLQERSNRAAKVAPSSGRSANAAAQSSFVQWRKELLALGELIRMSISASRVSALTRRRIAFSHHREPGDGAQ